MEVRGSGPWPRASEADCLEVDSLEMHGVKLKGGHMEIEGL